MLEYKFGAGRYRQERGALALLGEEAAVFGKKVYILGGPTALASVGNLPLRSLTNAGVSFDIEVYEGAASVRKANEIADKVRGGYDMIIGVGGGRIMDTVKAAAALTPCPVITVPTVAATCAAFTPLSIQYFDDGRFDHTVWHPTEVDAVIVDTDVLFAAPLRYLIAGILDSMAKYVEISGRGDASSILTDTVNHHSATFYSKYIFDTLFEITPRVLEARRAGEHSKLFDDAVFITIALTGVVSGIMHGKGQTALAHPFYDAIRKEFYDSSVQFLHGEIVAVGMLAQYLYDLQPEDAVVLRDFMRSLSLPCTLPEIGVEGRDDQLELIVDFVKSSDFPPENEERVRRLWSALRTLKNGVPDDLKQIV